MAPGKSKKHQTSFKPTISYAHPSLGTRPTPPPPTASPTSVSDRIQFLRKVQRPPAPNPADLEQDLATIHIRTPPRGRIAGPPPPRSWISGDVSNMGSARPMRSGVLRPCRPNYFPGISMPGAASFTHLLLERIARDIHWHLVYDHVYLPPDGINATEIKTLFATPEASGLEEATGADGLDRLDLACSMGRSLSFTELAKLWTKSSKSTTHDEDHESVSPPESWEDSWDLWQARISPSIRSNLHFPAVTKLSLAYPGREANWTNLVSFSKHLGQLTHLSLAGWPRPTVPFDDAITSTCSDLKRVIAREHHDLACDVLRVIGRNTPHLTYLSLADCNGWIEDLKESKPTTEVRKRASRLPRADVSNAFDDVQQAGAGTSRRAVSSIWSYLWKSLQTLELSQSQLPPRNVDTSSLRALYEARRWRWSDHILGPSDEDPQSYTVADLTRIRGQGSEVEAYTVTGSTSSVANIAERFSKRQWTRNEVIATELGVHVNRARIRAGLKILNAEHGWGPKELREAGYTKEEVWRVTGEDG